MKAPLPKRFYLLPGAMDPVARIFADDMAFYFKHNGHLKYILGNSYTPPNPFKPTQVKDSPQHHHHTAPSKYTAPHSEIGGRPLSE